MGLEKREKSCGDGGGSAEHTAHKEREIPSRQKRRGEEHSWKLLSLRGDTSSRISSRKENHDVKWCS